MISNCGHDENRRYNSGRAGDQTGGEYAVIPWYSRPWLCVLRHPDRKVGNRIAKIARNAAENPNIGYDQYERLGMYNQLKANGWKVNGIKTPCETDCSASTAAVVIAVGHQLGIEALQKVNPACTTWNLRATLAAAGFQELTESRYLVSGVYLLPGDILLNDQHHVAINLDAGALAYGGNHTGGKPDLASATPNLKRGSKGIQVGHLQEDLNHIMKSGLIVDGEFGPATENALKAFQRRYGLVPDGIYGEMSRAKMGKLL